MIDARFKIVTIVILGIAAVATWIGADYYKAPSPSKPHEFAYPPRPIYYACGQRRADGKQMDECWSEYEAPYGSKREAHNNWTPPNLSASTITSTSYAVVLSGTTCIQGNTTVTQTYIWQPSP